MSKDSKDASFREGPPDVYVDVALVVAPSKRSPRKASSRTAREPRDNDAHCSTNQRDILYLCYRSRVATRLPRTSPDIGEREGTSPYGGDEGSSDHERASLLFRRTRNTVPLSGQGPSRRGQGGTSEGPTIPSLLVPRANVTDYIFYRESAHLLLARFRHLLLHLVVPTRARAQPAGVQRYSRPRTSRSEPQFTYGGSRAPQNNR